MATMKTLPLNDLEPITFEYFCSEFLSQLKNQPFVKRGVSGQSQNGYDLTTLDSQFKVECKRYTHLRIADFKAFIKKFADEKPNIEESLIFCFSCKFEVTSDVDQFTNHNSDSENSERINSVVTELVDSIINNNPLSGDQIASSSKLKVVYYDLTTISKEIFDNKMFGLVYRYFSSNTFNDFFDTLRFEYIAPESVFNHYRRELFLGEIVGFTDAITDNLIKENSVFINLDIINKVEENLKNHKVCVIEGAEGRGKTVLSRIISYRKYHDLIEKHNVFFLDLKRNDTVDKIDNQIKLFADDKNKYSQQCLIVFENAHAYQDINELINKWKFWIMSGKENKKGHNLFFLINSRSTEGVSLFNEWSSAFKITLLPDSADVKGIINVFNTVSKTLIINDNSIDSFIFDKIFSEKNKLKGANLRLLYLFYESWVNSGRIGTLENIDEEKILLSFASKYEIDRLPRSDKLILLKFSALCQFDIPVYFEYGTMENSFLNDKGLKNSLWGTENDLFRLPHSIDAIYLCKALCKTLKKDYHEETANEVSSYVDFMIKNSELIPEIHFSQIIVELIERKSESPHFVDILNKLWNISPKGKAKEILTNLNMGFLFMILRNPPDMNTKRAEILEFYTDNKQDFKNRLLKINPIILGSINSTLIAAYNYKNLARDIFSTQADLDPWLKELNVRGGYIRKLLSNISEINQDYGFAVNDYKLKRSIKDEKYIKDYYFNNNCIGQKSPKLNNKFIRKFYNEAVNKDELIKKLNGAKICFDRVSWAALARLFEHIVDFYKIRTNDDKRAQNAAKKLFNEILFNQDSFNFVTDNELSSILEDLQVIDSNYYYNILKELPIINCMKSKLQNFGYSEDEKILLKHFIHSEFLKGQIHNIFSKADENQKVELKMLLDAENAQ